IAQFKIDVTDHPPPDPDIKGVTARLGVDETEEGGTSAGPTETRHLTTDPDRPGQRSGDGSVDPIENFGDTEGRLHDYSAIPPSVIFFKSRARSRSSAVIRPSSRTSSRTLRPLAEEA